VRQAAAVIRLHRSYSYGYAAVFNVRCSANLRYLELYSHTEFIITKCNTKQISSAKSSNVYQIFMGVVEELLISTCIAFLARSLNRIVLVISDTTRGCWFSI